MPDPFRVLSSASIPAQPLSPKLPERSGNRRFIRVMIGAGTIAAVLALLSASPLVRSGAAPAAGISAGPTSASAIVAPSQPETFAIAPASVVETKPVFFFGTGDNSAGFYAERPTP